MNEQKQQWGGPPTEEDIDLLTQRRAVDWPPYVRKTRDLQWLVEAQEMLKEREQAQQRKRRGNR